MYFNMNKIKRFLVAVVFCNVMQLQVIKAQDRLYPNEFPLR
jgi:hypothetical protein